MNEATRLKINKISVQKADEKHKKMLRWYAEQLNVDVININIAMVELSEDKAQQLYKQWEEKNAG